MHSLLLFIFHSSSFIFSMLIGDETSIPHCLSIGLNSSGIIDLSSSFLSFSFEVISYEISFLKDIRMKEILCSFSKTSKST